MIAYDTPCNRRRRRLARLADDFGCRVQLSVFQGWLSPAMYRSLAERIGSLIDPDEDRVLVLSACAGCQGQIRTFGRMRLETLPRCWII
ncbi:MAG: CRISPR-associated endonuclease Cas2 [Phycisphaerales bacterium]|nr:CRISPR-associated endonuclease Cas2 [Phycisphaerales bacterium]